MISTGIRHETNNKIHGISLLYYVTVGESKIDLVVCDEMV
jgi:hypothetical protein